MTSLRARRGPWLSAAGVLFLVLATVWMQNHALDRRAGFAAEDDVLFLPRSSALKALSLGHHEMMADFIVIRALVYFGSELTSKGDFRWLDNYLQTTVDLDPDRLELDEDGESMFMPSVEVLALLCERYNAQPPKQATVQKWHAKYLKVFDGGIDALKPAPEFKTKRRKAIENTFRWLESLAQTYWSH